MIKKFCTNCQTEKDISEFRPNKTKKDGYQHYCGECDRNFQQQWYRKNKERLVNKAKISNKRNNANMHIFMLDFLQGKSCLRCGEDNILVLEFDHLKDKKFQLSSMANRSKNQVIEEISKCQILCANCHKIKTHEQRNTYKWRYSQAIRQDSAKIPPQV